MSNPVLMWMEASNGVDPFRIVCPNPDLNPREYIVERRQIDAFKNEAWVAVPIVPTVHAQHSAKPRPVAVQEILDGLFELSQGLNRIPSSKP